MDIEGGVADWISLSSDIRRAMARMPSSPATAINRYCAENGVDPARAARAVRAREGLDRLCRRHRVDVAEVAVDPSQVQSLVQAENEDPVHAAAWMARWIRGEAEPPRREPRPRALGRGLDLRAMALACLVGDPNSRADVELPRDLGPAGQFCRIDQEMVVANAQPDERGRIRSRILHALVVSPRLAPSREPGRPPAQAMLGVCAALAFFDRGHFYACDAAEAEAMARVKAASTAPERLSIHVHHEGAGLHAGQPPRQRPSTAERGLVGAAAPGV